MCSEPIKNIRQRGLSLIESLASITILTIGIVAVISCLGAASRTESRIRQMTIMTDMARHEYDELIATNTSLSQSQSGDFTEENNTSYKWSADVEQTGVTNLVALTVTVSSATDTSANAVTGHVTGLLYQSPNTTTTTTTTTAGTAAGGGAAKKGG